jgi:multidrug efflux pump subunit AcrB
MWIVRIALSRPYTFVVLALVLFLFAPVMLMRTPVDIFPAINVPLVSIIWADSGLVPSEMASRIASVYERALTTTVDNIEHIESQSLYGVSVVKVYLQPQANVDGAIAEVIAEASATMKQLPPGIQPPLVIRYSASTVPILQIGLSGKNLSEQQLNDFATNFIRPGVATANSILVISFANQRFAATKDGALAALEAGATRLRPVLMTASAMIIGMIPMALGLGEGGEQNAPLGRAVIGGLSFATIATLFFVPTVFAILRREKEPGDAVPNSPNEISDQSEQDIREHPSAPSEHPARKGILKQISEIVDRVLRKHWDSQGEML